MTESETDDSSNTAPSKVDKRIIQVKMASEAAKKDNNSEESSDS